MHTPRSAELTWDAQGQPLSTRFDDVYFSTTSGLEETRHVFLQHTQLEQRWTNLPADALFHIGETGFGSGLNFLAAWQCWLQCAPVSAQLHFVSVEKHPLNRTDLIRAHALWPELQPLASQLQAQYPAQLPGFHRLQFGKVHLTLIYADAYDGLSQLLLQRQPGPELAPQTLGWGTNAPAAQMDAWFLDGFAPAKNPDMWRPELLHCIARLSKPGTQLATFTAASAVRKGLQEVGFEVRKVAGFGRKREMVAAAWLGATPEHPLEPAPHPQASEPQAPNSQPPSLQTSNPQAPKPKPPSSQAPNPQPSPSWPFSLPSAPPPKHVVVIGAGLAGCHSAWALAQKGLKVSVIDQAEVASGASGNAQGVVYAKLSHRPDVLAEFNLSAYQFACRFYHSQGLFERVGQACGVLHLAQTEAQAHQYQTIAQQMAQAPELAQWLPPDQASKTAGVPLDCGALYLPQSGWLAPRALCAALLDHPNITTQWFTPITRIEAIEGADSQARGWQLYSDALQQSWQADVVIVACAYHSTQFSQCQDLPVKAIRGQVTHARATPQSAQLAKVLCGDGYLAPAHHGQHCLGASFDLHSTEPATRSQDHDSNLKKIGRLSSGLGPLQVARSDDGRVGFRCATRDYLPIVGPIPQKELMQQRFAAYRRNAKTRVDQTGVYWSGLYAHLGHGSRGLTYAPLTAEVLACQITGAALPIPTEQMLHLHPARFLIRDLTRNRD